MSKFQILDACILLVIGSAVALFALAHYNKPGHAFMPDRKAMTASYWGLICFFGGAALLGLFILTASFWRP